jgi:small conductance mechanosensitive channel
MRVARLIGAIPPAIRVSIFPLNTAFLANLQLLMVNSGIRLIAAIMILIVGWMLATWIKRWLVAALQHLPIDLTLKPLLGSLVRYAILIVTIILVMGQFGVQTTSLIAILGATGLAIGLAMQGTLSNVAAGVMLLILRPFRVGQFVQIASQSGTVREIGLFTTIITTRDSVYISVPNSSIFSAPTFNYTREPLRRVNFTVPVDFVNDLDKVREVIGAALAKSEHVLKTPEPWTDVSELQEYAVVMFVRCYVRSGDYWRAMPTIQRDVKTALDKAAILIAVSRQAAIVRNEPQSPLNAAPPAAE